MFESSKWGQLYGGRVLLGQNMTVIGRRSLVQTQKLAGLKIFGNRRQKWR